MLMHLLMDLSNIIFFTQDKARTYIWNGVSTIISLQEYLRYNILK